MIVKLLTTETGGPAVVLFLGFVVFVTGGIIRLLRNKRTVELDQAVCITCQLENPTVCQNCSYEPIHDQLEHESQ